MITLGLHECEWEVTVAFVDADLKYRWYAVTYTTGREGDFLQSEPNFDTPVDARANWVSLAKEYNITQYKFIKE